MDTLWTSLIAAGGSLAGVLLGIISTRSGERAQDRRLSVARRQAAADAVADELLAALKQLRHLPEEHFEEATAEVFLPRHWYEQYEPALLRAIGDIDDGDTRRALRDIVTSLGDPDLQPEKVSMYHHVERQILTGLEITQSFKRSEPLEPETAQSLAALRRRIDDKQPF